MEALHLAYSGTDDYGIAKDVSLLLDTEETGALITLDVFDRLTAFLRTCGIIGDTEVLTTVI